MSAVIYARASTGEQVSSCDQQVRECTAKAKQLGLKMASVYKDDGNSWLKIKNKAYTQAEGRHELLTKRK